MKRLLSLALVLVMLVLAVPVFVLPTLAADGTTINFVIGDNLFDRTTTPIEGSDTNVLANYDNRGDVALATPWASVATAMPGNAELAAYSLTTDDILTWARWDSTVNSFIDIKEYINGSVELPAGAEIDFYPIYKDSELGANGNLPYWSFNRTEVAEGGAFDAAGTGTMNAFRGGYSLIEWKRSSNTVYSYFTRMNTTYASTYYDGSVYGVFYLGFGDCNLQMCTDSSWTAAVQYQVMASADMEITVPAIAGLSIVVIHNDKVVFGDDAAIGNSAADTENDNWYAFKAEDSNKTVKVVGAKKGDIIRIAAYRSDTTIDQNSTVRFSPAFKYTNIVADKYLAETSFTNNRPTPATSATPATGGDPIEFHGGWDYVSYGNKDLEGIKYFDKRIGFSGGPGFVIGDSCGNGYIMANGAGETSYWPNYGIGLYWTGQIISTRYTSPKTGKIDVSIDRLMNVQLNAAVDALTLEYAIYVGGEKVWPVNDTGDWYSLSYYGASVPANLQTGNVGAINSNVAASVNDQIPNGISITAGDTVDFLIRAVEWKEYDSATGAFKDPDDYLGMYRAHWNYFDGTVSFLEGTNVPLVNVQPSIADTLDLAFSLSYEAASAGILVNGKPATGISLAPEQGDEPITVQAYIDVEGNTVYGAKKTITFNSVIERFLDDATYGAAAAAALAYTKAFKAYFAEEGVVADATAGTYEVPALKAADNPGATVGFTGASLLLNRLVNIKVTINGDASVYKLEIADNAAFNDSKMIGGTGNKFIMDGISAKNWNTSYYFRVVSADGTVVVSDTLCYSVAAYYTRMSNNDNANIKNLTATMMNLYEAVK